MNHGDPIEVLFIDVDGTLHGADGIHPRVWPAVEAARRAGLALVLCTGRPGFGIAREYAGRLDPVGPHIFEAGACVADANGEVLRAEPLGPAYPELLSLAEAHGVVAEVFTADGRYVVAERTADVRAHEALLETTAELGDLRALSSPDLPPIIRVQWLLPEGVDHQPFFQRVEDDPTLELHIGRSPSVGHIVFTGVTRAGVSKASAARWVAERLGSPSDLSRAAMVGDGLNDLDLLQVVGRPMAMSNGEPEVIAAVEARGGLVMPPVDQGGAAVAIESALATRER